METDALKLVRAKLRERIVAAALTAFTTPSRSALRMFCIFMASMMATVSPVLTSWPTSTGMATTSPGIGDRTSLEVSAATFSGSRA